jgi:DNA topoisomerase-1
VEAYCVKCKQKRMIENPKPTFTSSGTPATQGICSVCGTKLFRMGKTPAHEGLEAPKSPPRKTRSGKAAKAGKRSGKLVIVESPAKARTVGHFLGKDYSVQASIGHVRDLLRSQLSVDVENNFKPKYRVPNEKRQVVKSLKKQAATAEEVYLATDPDREGEAIAWHLLEAAEIEPDRAKRVVFHEITESAIQHAFHTPRMISMDLVDAQQARRILDRLVGYNISPILWSKVKSRLSAGRVQSAALRIIVDREKEIRDFVPIEYWSIDAEFLNQEKPPAFRARLIRVNGESPAAGSEGIVNDLLGNLRKASYRVQLVKSGKRTRRPFAPFITSTLQQEASRRLRFSAQRTMRIAQQLYEGIELAGGEAVGLITYMRTDSPQVSHQAIQEAREVIRERFGENYLPHKPPFYRSKSRMAQEAHEAIRPTSVRRYPEHLKGLLTTEQFNLYELIWKRFMASQMMPAVYDTLTIEVEGLHNSDHYLFRVAASRLRFAGFLEVYGEASEEKPETREEEGIEAVMTQLPDLVEGDVVDMLELFPEQHFTQPPPRYSDASLIRSLEEHGIGRPSTYAPILSTIQQRGYVERQNRRFQPTAVGELVNDLVVDYFPEIVDLGFTARMEEDLDKIAEGSKSWVEVVRNFYVPFEAQVDQAKERMPEVKVEPIILDRACPNCGNPLTIREGRFGKFIGCSDFPTCRYTEPWLEKIGVKCPQCDGEIVQRRTRRGRIFYGCSNYPQCDFASWKQPLPQPCPKCGGVLVKDNRKSTCLNCKSHFD